MLDPRIEDLAKRVKILEEIVGLLVEKHTYNLGGNYLTDQINEIREGILKK